MTSKQRAYLKSLASTLDPLFQIGKGSVTPEVVEAMIPFFTESYANSASVYGFAGKSSKAAEEARRLLGRGARRTHQTARPHRFHGVIPQHKNPRTVGIAARVVP